jgi:hypothetical protein
VPARWRYLGLLAIQLAVGCRNGADTVNVETQQIGSYSEITGLWQFQDVAGHYLAVLEKDDAEGQSTITVLRLQDAGWSAIRTIVSDDMSIWAIDGHAIDTKLYVCTELNGSEALQLVSAEVAQLRSGLWRWVRGSSGPASSKATFRCPWSWPPPPTARSRPSAAREKRAGRNCSASAARWIRKRR